MSELECVTVSAFVEPGEPVLVIPAGHWRILVWLHAELTWKFNEHRHNARRQYSTDWGPIMPHWK